MEISTRIKIIAVIAVVVGPILAVTGYRDKERLAKLEKDGVTVDGIIEGGEWSKKRRSSNYQFDVSYNPTGGTPVKQVFKVTSSFYAAHTKDNLITDETVKVRYLPDEMQDSAILVGGSTDETALFGVGIGAFVLGLLTSIFMFFIKR